MRRQILALASLILFALSPIWAQEQKSQDDMPGMTQLPALANASTLSTREAALLRRAQTCLKPTYQVLNDTEMPTWHAG